MVVSFAELMKRVTSVAQEGSWDAGELAAAWDVPVQRVSDAVAAVGVLVSSQAEHEVIQWGVRFTSRAGGGGAHVLPQSSKELSLLYAGEETETSAFGVSVVSRQGSFGDWVEYTGE